MNMKLTLINANYSRKIATSMESVSKVSNKLDK